jgi:hypothetical protein
MRSGSDYVTSRFVLELRLEYECFINDYLRGGGEACGLTFCLILLDIGHLKDREHKVKLCPGEIG